MEGFTDAVTGETRRGFIDIVRELRPAFLTRQISLEKEKKPSSNCLANICGLKIFCKTTMSSRH
jgi:type I restriction enzyme R subunit